MKDKIEVVKCKECGRWYVLNFESNTFPCMVCGCKKDGLVFEKTFDQIQLDNDYSLMIYIKNISTYFSMDTKELDELLKQYIDEFTRFMDS